MHKSPDNTEYGQSYFRAWLLVPGLSLCLATAVVAQPAPRSAELRMPEDRTFFQPREGLQLAFSPGVAEAELNHMYLELNAVDVSDLTRWTPRGLQYQPPHGLTPGVHDLRLIYFDENDQLHEIGSWSLEVRHSEALLSVTLDSQSEVTANARLNERNDSGSRGRNVQAYSEWSGAMETDRWRLQSQAEIAYANRRQQSITGNRLDMPSFSMQARSDWLRVAVGDQRMGQSSLVMNGYQQRGVASDVQLDTLNSSISLFSMSGQRAAGVDDGLGLSDSNDRINGARWDSSWQPGQGHAIQLSATRVTGRISQADAGTWNSGSFTRVNDGEAWNATVDGSFFDRALQVRGERAASEYDFDGHDFGFAPISDDAWSGSLVLDPLPMGQDTPINWQLGAEARKIGGYFRSLANRQLSGDRHGIEFFAAVQRDKWTLDADFLKERNNLDHDPDYARTETRQWSMQLGYSDYEVPDAGSLLEWLGQPSYTLTLDDMQRRDQYTPIGYWPNDLESRGARLEASFARELGYWSAGLGQERLTDNTGWQPDTETRFLQWQAGIDIGDHHQLNLGWQLDQTRYRAGNERVNQQIYTVGGNSQLIPGRLSVSLDLNFSRNDAEEDPFFAQYQDSLYTSGQLHWHIREARPRRPGLDLSLSFSRNTLRDRLYNDPTQHDHQVWLELRTTLPTRYPGGGS